MYKVDETFISLFFKSLDNTYFTELKNKLRDETTEI